MDLLKRFWVRLAFSLWKKNVSFVKTSGNEQKINYDTELLLIFSRVFKFCDGITLAFRMEICYFHIFSLQFNFLLQKITNQTIKKQTKKTHKTKPKKPHHNTQANKQTASTKPSPELSKNPTTSICIYQFPSVPIILGTLSFTPPVIPTLSQLRL